MPHTFEDLTAGSSATLHQLWGAGEAPEPGALAGRVFRGRNTALLARLAGNGPFAKGFIQTSSGLEGCNFPARVRQGVWTVDTTRPFGFFRVTRMDEPGDDGPRSALLIDYGQGRPDALRTGGPGLALRVVERMARPLRDVLVRPPGAADDVYLGRAFFGARRRLHVSYFVIESWRTLTGDHDVNIVATGSVAGRTEP